MRKQPPLSSNNYFNLYIFLFGMLGCGLWAILLGKDLSWDMANYHFYGPFAFLTGREQYDYWPSSYVHQFFNPTLDFSTFFLLNYFSPLMATLILGCIHGLNFGFLFLIARQFASSSLIAFTLACLSIYGPIALPGMGSFQNDNFISIFILVFVYLQLKNLQYISTTHGFIQRKLLFVSGLMLGAGVGLKFTAAIFGVGMVAAILILSIPFMERLKMLSYTVFGSAVGLLLTAGYWMLLMYQRYGNPVFPFFNQVLHSPNFPLINWHDLRFLPTTWLQTLFYPFYFSLDGRISDYPFQDIRFSVVYLLLIFNVIFYMWQKIIKHKNITAIKATTKLETNTKNKPTSNLKIIWFFSFFIFSYLIWQIFFSIARYLVTLEMLAPLAIYLLIRLLIKPHLPRQIFATCIFYSMIFMMIPATFIRAPWYDHAMFNVQLPKSINNIKMGTVITAYSVYSVETNPRPQFYLIPFFYPKWHFTAIPFQHNKFVLDKTTIKKLQAFLKDSPSPFYLLTSDINMRELLRAAKKFHLSAQGPCEKIVSDRQKVTHLDVLLCPVKLI